MPRLLFEKRGNAVWISHLDLMRVFQRGFKRAGLALTHTHGFNPRPSVSIALPLSVGIESSCELLDFDFDGEKPDNEEIANRLNSSLIDGVKVLRVYDDGGKIKNLAFLDCILRLEYDNGVYPDCIAAIRTLFDSESVIVDKKSKNGIAEQNIIPMIRSFQVDSADCNTVVINCRICCQNPALNPMQILAAITKYLPDFTPDFVTCSRIEIYDTQEKIFR